MDQRERARRLERRRRLRLARNALLGAVLGLAAANVWLGHSDWTPPTPAVSSSATASAAEVVGSWRAELGRLDACRNRLLSGRDGSALECYAPDSPAEAADRRALDELIQREVEFARLPLEIISADVIDKRWSDSGEFVRLFVRDELDSNQVRVDGQQVSLPSRPPAEWEVTLWREGPERQWRWYEVRPAQQRTPARAWGAAN